MKVRFLGNLIIKGEIECVTALHIGGTVEGYEIGGMDNPVIKDPVTGYPYIPGSSLKGKMRSLLEWALDKVEESGDVHVCNDTNCPVCRIFGVPAETERNIGPTRLIVRDAWPTGGTRDMLKKLQQTRGLPKVEWKWENSINRITSMANPRAVERVPKGSRFEFEVVFSLFDVSGDSAKPDLEFVEYVFQAMKLLEDSYLGGYGSRGSGKIKFLVKELRLKTLKDYESHAEGELLEAEAKPLQALDFSGIKGKIQQKLVNL